MDKLQWCLQVRRGIKLISPNENLAKGYEEQALETLKLLKSTTASQSWRVVFSYYAMYYKAYSLLQSIGIKSELHSCTIAILRFLGSDELASKLEEMKKKREEAQYYVGKRVPEVSVKEVLKFFNRVDLLRESIRGEERKVRKKLRELLELANPEEL